MTIEIVNKKRTARPLGIFLISIWSLMRAVALILDLSGQYALHQTFDVLLGGKPESAKFNVFLFLEYLLKGGADRIIPLAFVIVFLVIGVGVLFGKVWGRSGYLIILAIMIFWNIGKINAWGGYSYPLYSLAAFILAYWYLRQPKVVEFFCTEIKVPELVRKKILNVPLDLAISLGIFAVLIILGLLKLMVMILLGLAQAG